MTDHSPERVSRLDRSHSTLIREETERILASPGFTRAERLQRFLRFVVECSLAEDDRPIKEYSIGVQVYDRSPGYDPKAEPIVRNEARRLRLKLAHYYETLGLQDPVIITIPQGGYKPHFEMRPPKIVSISEPVLVVQPSLEHKQTGEVQAPIFARPGRWWIVAALTAIVIAGRIWYSASPKERLPVRVSSVARYAGYEFRPSLSPDGKQVAFVWDGGKGDPQIYVKLIGSEDTLQLTREQAHDVNPVWAPDGSKIAFLRLTPKTKDLLTVSSLGGQPQLICSTHSAQPFWVEDASIMMAVHSPGPTWSPDGQYLAITDKTSSGEIDSIYFVSAANGEKIQFTYPRKTDVGDYYPAFSPDGRWLAFARETHPQGENGLFVQRIGSRTPERITRDVGLITGVTWVSSDRIVYSSNRAGGDRLFIVPRWGGSATVIEAAGRSAYEPSASPDGKRLVYTEAFWRSDIWRFDVQNSPKTNHPAREWIASQGRNSSAQYSPDGKRIAFVSDRSGYQEIWLCDADGANAEQVTSSRGAPLGTPRWSPNGKQLLFDSVRDGFSGIYLLHLQEKAGPRKLIAGPHNYMMPGWSRDGASIYFASDEGGGSTWKESLSGGVQKFIANGMNEVYESPSSVLYLTSFSPGIRRISGSDGPKAVSGLETVDPSRHVAATSRGLYYLQSQRPPWSICLFDWRTQRTSSVAGIERAPEFGTPSLSVSPDDRWALISQLDQSGSVLLMLEDFQ